ncbi:MAG: flagellar basal body-associated FliL family protein [Eubacterium sp.]|nr:flagellar basal body-associated FliL family protein [Eubacterium sp.]
MKKNLLTLIILVLCFANVALTAVLVITILPETQKANELITKVADAIDLDLEGGTAVDTSESVSMENITSYSVNDGESMTINLADSGDGTQHFAVITVSIEMDSTHEDYATYTDLSTYSTIIMDLINEVVSAHTLDEMQNNQTDIKKEVLEALQTKFDSTVFTGVSFGSVTLS